MSVTYANQKENHRAVYFEATGDGSTTALTVNHNRGLFAGTTAQAYVVTAPTGVFTRRSERGGLRFPDNGTAATVSSVTVTQPTAAAAGSVTINTSSAVGNSTVAYCVVVFDQPSASN